MKYLSVCSGIEAASKAWEPIGWKPVAFSEIEPFPSAVLKHHWPEIPNLGDMSKYEQWPIQSGSVDLLVGGTPCQAFSVAGLRKGLDDPRGGLTLTFVRIADHFNPNWIVWENVPGVFTSKDNGFGCFLGALAGEDGELQPPGGKWKDAGCVFGPKRSIAWRCLDAQYFGVAQRRKRCFLVACPRDYGDPTKVLFEWASLRRDSAPSRSAGKETSTHASGSTRDSSQSSDSVAENYWTNPESPCDTLLARDYKGIGNQDLTTGRLLVKSAIPIHDQATRHAGKRGEKQDGKGNGLGVGKDGDPCPTLTKGDKHAVLYENHPNDSRVTGPLEVAPSCVSRYGTGGGNVPLVQEGVDLYNQTLTGDVHCPLRTAGGHGAPATLVQKAVAVDCYNKTIGDKSKSISSLESDINHTVGVINPADRMAVRRLTPRECERLQGFNDDHTLIPWRNKPASECPDGPRYKALGNSMAVPCMQWIGKRIDAVDRNNRKDNK
jgi:DNA (cytosine-5)-methyltransferase 1